MLSRSLLHVGAGFGVIKCLCPHRSAVGGVCLWSMQFVWDGTLVSETLADDVELCQAAGGG